MSFNRLPPEIHDMIAKEYKTDPSRVEASSKDLLKNTLALTQINRRYRALSLSNRHKDLFSILHLHWPREAVEEFLRRCENQDLTVFLNTRLPNNRKGREEVERWISFFSSNMGRIVSLQLDIPLGRAGRGIADIIANTPAPLLRSLKLYLNETARDNMGMYRLLDYNAPNLRHAQIHADQLYDLPSFTSICELSLKIGHHNFKRLLSMLGEMKDQLKTIRLLGVKRWESRTLPRNLEEPLVFSACTSLSIQNCDAVQTSYLISNISIPNPHHLKIQENLVQDHYEDGAFLSSLFLTLPQINAKSVDSLSLGIHCNHFVVEMPGFQYEGRWRHMADHDITLTPFVINATTVLADSLDPRPSTLIIENSIGLLEWLAPSPAAIVLPDVDEILGEIFTAFTSVRTLEICGNADPAIHALFPPNQLPNLSNLIIQQQYKKKLVTDYDPESLAELAKRRKFKIACR